MKTARPWTIAVIALCTVLGAVPYVMAQNGYMCVDTGSQYGPIVDGCFADPNTGACSGTCSQTHWWKGGQCQNLHTIYKCVPLGTETVPVYTEYTSCYQVWSQQLQAYVCDCGTTYGSTQETGTQGGIPYCETDPI